LRQSIHTLFYIWLYACRQATTGFLITREYTARKEINNAGVAMEEAGKLL
jgi:hypothetical protein